MNEKILTAINNQINAELYSSYLYYSMSINLILKGFNGFAKWLCAHAEEEKKHARKLIMYLIDKGEQIFLQEIDAPPQSWNSILDIFEEILEHEKGISFRIKTLADICEEINDRCTLNFLNSFIDEQTKKEAEIKSIISKIKLVNSDSVGLIILSKELGNNKKCKCNCKCNK